MLYEFFNPNTSIQYHTQTMLGHHILRVGELHLQPFNYEFGDHFVTNILSPWNPWLYIVLFSIPFGIKDVQCRSPKSIFFIWGMLYLVPYMIIELLFNVGMATYVSFGIVPMSIYTTLFLYEKIGSILSCLNKKIRAAIFALILGVMGFCMLSISCYKVFSCDIYKYFKNIKKPFLDEPFRYRSSYYYDVGYKTLGYYIRSYGDSSETIVVYDVMFNYSLKQYYLAWKTYPQHPSYQELQKLIEEKIDEIDILVTIPKAKGLFDTFSQFEIKSNIYSQSLNKERQLVLLIYGKKNSSLPKIDMDTQKYNPLYDKHYSFTGKSAKRFLTPKM